MNQGDDIARRVRIERTKTESAVENLDESSWLTWLWVGLFGPIYFAWHGFWGRFVLSIIAGLPVLAAPPLWLLYWPAMIVLAHFAWRDRARKEVNRVLSRPQV